MRRRFPVLGVTLILIGAGGLVWLSAFEGGPWGAGGAFVGPGMMPMMPWMGPGVMGGVPARWYGKTSFASDGERIYFTGVSARTGPIRASAGPMWVGMRGGGCVACHGVQGRGGVPVMMGGAIPEDIRYEALTKSEQEEREPGGKPGEEEEMEHPPYTDALIKRAITQGVDAAGKPLDWTMPRWQMGDADFADLLAYLKTLR